VPEKQLRNAAYGHCFTLKLNARGGLKPTLPLLVRDCDA